MDSLTGPNYRKHLNGGAWRHSSAEQRTWQITQVELSQTLEQTAISQDASSCRRTSTVHIDVLVYSCIEYFSLHLFWDKSSVHHRVT